MKTTAFSIMFFAATYVVSFAQVPVHAFNYTLPKNDVHYRCVKDWIEDNIDADYQHPSAATIEAFRDIKFGVRIHWGLYSITGKGGESWPTIVNNLLNCLQITERLI